MVDGLSIFYREAGRPDAPTLLLLHGFPSSSRMYEPLLTRFSTYYHLVAPDYPGFGHSDAPGAKAFSYTFDHIAQVMEHFTEALGLDRYALYMQDYGGPVGFRLAISHPERVQALIIQNAVAHDEGLGPLWQKRREFWADRAANEAGLRANFSSFAATKQRHVGSNPDPETLDPDRWTDEFAFLSRPGEDDIQIDLFYDYRTNVTNYPAWGAWSAAPTAHVGYLGQVRPLVPGCRDGRLSARSAWGGGPHPRCRSLCTLREATRDRRAGWRFSGTHARSASRAQAMTATVSASASAVAHSANG
jgi:pimeloyl-ACP methyl ester carboxylesterase